MIDGHYHAITLAHPALDDALLAGFDLDDLGADLVVLGAITHEYVRHVVGDFSGDRVAVFDRDGLAGPF